MVDAATIALLALVILVLGLVDQGPDADGELDEKRRHR